MSGRRRLVTNDFREYVLAELRTARLRAKMYVNEIEAIGIALKAHMIEPEDALAWMQEAGTLDFMVPTSPEQERVRIDLEGMDGRIEANNADTDGMAIA